MKDSETYIHHVSDTALWVAYYRAKESKRQDALFKDNLADVLIGKQGQKIAENMNYAARYIEYNVIMRTLIIDKYIEEVIEEGIDTVINLGAGLDTRPYRMSLPSTLRWIEVDHQNIIDHKNNLLKSEIPTCQLSRVAIDLADNKKRKAFLQEAASQSKRILVITEGVVPYLTETQVEALAVDLNSCPEFIYWIVEYLSPKVYPHLQSSERVKKMKNAPFLFFPKDWIGFFDDLNWLPKEQRFYGIEGEKVNRPMPAPWWAFIFKFIAPKAAIEQSKKIAGFILLKRK